MSWLVLLLASIWRDRAAGARADTRPRAPSFAPWGRTVERPPRRRLRPATGRCSPAGSPAIRSPPSAWRVRAHVADQSSILFNLANIHFRSGSLSQAASAVDSSSVSIPTMRAPTSSAPNSLPRGRTTAMPRRTTAPRFQLEPGSTSAYLGRAYAFSASKQYAAAKDDMSGCRGASRATALRLSAATPSMPGSGRCRLTHRLAGDNNPVDEIGRALAGSPPPPPRHRAQAAPPAPPRQTAEAPPAPAAPLGSAPLEGTEARQQAINSQVQQGPAALGYKVARTRRQDRRVDREAIRRFASQQKVKAPENSRTRLSWSFSTRSVRPRGWTRDRRRIRPSRRRRPRLRLTTRRRRLGCCAHRRCSPSSGS